jgi:broad specificity phosphatase PhoE
LIDPQRLRALFLARHGETESNLVRRYAGWSNEPLTDRGRRQAVDLGRTLSGAGVTRVRTSDIARASETAVLVADVLGVPVVADDRLNELRMGPWDGLTEDEIAERYPKDYDTWLRYPHELRIAGRESLDDVAARLYPALVESASNGHTELLITHVALVRLAVLMAERRCFSEYKSIDVPNCVARWVPVPPVETLPAGVRGAVLGTLPATATAHE